MISLTSHQIAQTIRPPTIQWLKPLDLLLPTTAYNSQLQASRHHTIERPVSITACHKYRPVGVTAYTTGDRPVKQTATTDIGLCQPHSQTKLAELLHCQKTIKPHSQLRSRKLGTASAQNLIAIAVPPSSAH